MSRLATMGTFSCATIAVSGFRDEDLKLNQKYEEDPSAFKLDTQGLSVNQFYKDILYPISQPLGKTKEYPFSMLMEHIDKSKMSDKFTILTMNSYQHNKPYWKEILKKFGFELIDKTNNSIGEVCYIYTRNRARVE